jgi:hypothetical protein
LQVRGLENNSFYALCERNPETYTHLFIWPYSREIWDMATTWSGCANLAPATGRYKMKLKIGSVAWQSRGRRCHTHWQSLPSGASGSKEMRWSFETRGYQWTRSSK